MDFLAPDSWAATANDGALQPKALRLTVSYLGTETSATNHPLPSKSASKVAFESFLHLELP